MHVTRFHLNSKRATLVILFWIVFFGSQTLSAQGFLHRSGRYIYDGAGNEVILRGIGTGNWMLQEGYMMQTSDIAGTQHAFRAMLTATIGEEKTSQFYEAWLENHFRRVDVDSMKSWGFNSVRVAMHYKWFTPPIEEEPVPGEVTWIDTGFTLIDSLLAWCSDNEMYLILDLHGAPGGQGKDAAISDYDPTKPSLWESQENKDKTIALWRKLAERYSEEPWIGGYDLINEVNWPFPGGNNAPLRELMVNITEAIREVDTNHIIFVEGNWFANDFSGMTPPWDDNMVYSFHKYWSFNTQASIQFALNLRNSHNIPIWMGESGENSNVWFASLIAMLEKNRIGWAMWPVKKPGINNPLRVAVNDDYTRLINHWRGTAPNPGVDAAFSAVMQFAENHRLENCVVQHDVIDALIRQPHTNETIPFKLVGTGEPVFAVDYNLGRSGYAYLDNDSLNAHLSTDIFVDWNKGWAYRNDGVDIQACSDTPLSNGYNIGWTEDGEWMEYTIQVDSTAAYRLDIRSASGASGSEVRLEIDGVSITPVISLPGTSGWQTWRTTQVPAVMLEEGVHKLRFVFDRGGSNLNYFMFSEPGATGSVAFQPLFAETSDDGRQIILTLNKAVDSISDGMNTDHFSVVCDGEAFPVNKVYLSEKSHNMLVLEMDEPLYYGGVIRLTYEGHVIFSRDQLLDVFEGMDVKNRLPFRFSLPARVQAEDYSYNNGLIAENCDDFGGGLNMGHVNPGDYLEYRVHIPRSATYDIHFRVASIRQSSEMLVQIDTGGSFSTVGNLVISSTGGWQNWQTLTMSGFFPEGRYTLRLFMKSGEFNLNWFQFVMTTVDVDTPLIPGIKIFPNPANHLVEIDLTGIQGDVRYVDVYNQLGQMALREQIDVTGLLQIDVSDLKEGVYIVLLRSEQRVLATSRLLINRKE